jgi:cation diffusion facilitator family transporter
VPSDSARIVYFSLACDLGIAVSKFMAAGFSGSSAMFSEGIHSVVDSLNAVLLLWGRRASRRNADDEHPFGYGKELYFWTLIVALLIFAAGGGMSIYDGIATLRRGSPSMQPGAWTYSVLAFSGIFEGATVWIAAKNFREAEGTRGFWSSIHSSKDPTIFTVLLDNLAAVLGVLIAFLGIWLSQVLRMPALDGIASILIGVLLAAVAIVMAMESKGLLVGEGMDKQTLENIRRLAQQDPAVVRVGRPMTMYFGPRSILLALEVEFEKGLSAAEVTSAVDRLESSIRSKYANIQRIFIEAESLSRAASASAAKA